VVGASGQAREVAWYLRALGHDCVALVVASEAEASAGEPVRSEDWLRQHIGEIDGFALGVGVPAARLRIAEKIRAEHPRVPWPTLVHPSAVVDTSVVKIDEGALIAAGAVLTTDISLGAFSMVNFGATIGHDVRIGRGVVINPGANVSGGVTIGDGSLIGAGAVVLQYRKIGHAVVVGAGAVVTHDVSDGETVVGIPARKFLR
jgi:sugar O-acyltransferase (sialic acid O-acetyltransferase NeuD family)